MKAPGSSVILGFATAACASATGIPALVVALASSTLESLGVLLAVKTSKSLSTRDELPSARVKVCPYLTVAIIRMLRWSGVREISTLPSPSVVEQTDLGGGQAETSHPTPLLQTLQANRPSALPLVSQ